MAVSQLVSFTHHLKSDPHVNFHSFRSELFQESMNTQNAILGQYGLLFIFLTDIEWNNLPGNLITAEILAAPEIVGVAAAVLAAPAVYRARYDFTTPVPPCPLNAANAVLAAVKTLSENKASVYAAYTLLRTKIINSIAEEDSVFTHTASEPQLRRKSTHTWHNDTAFYRKQISLLSAIACAQSRAPHKRTLH